MRNGFLLISLLFLSSCTELPQGYPKQCSVHHADLRAQRVEIVYGLPAEAFDSEYQRNQATLFPHANEWVSGGCCSTTFGEFKSPTSQVVGYCPQCRQAFDRWQKARGGWHIDEAVSMDPEYAAKADRAAAEAWKSQQERLLRASEGVEVANPPPPR